MSPGRKPRADYCGASLAQRWLLHFGVGQELLDDKPGGITREPLQFGNPQGPLSRCAALDEENIVNRPSSDHTLNLRRWPLGLSGNPREGSLAKRSAPDSTRERALRIAELQRLPCNAARFVIEQFLPDSEMHQPALR